MDISVETTTEELLKGMMWASVNCLVLLYLVMSTAVEFCTTRRPRAIRPMGLMEWNKDDIYTVLIEVIHQIGSIITINVEGLCVEWNDVEIVG